MLTDSEAQALNAILDKAIAEADDGDPAFEEVDAADVNPFGNQRDQSDVYDALSKKGFIQCSGPAGGPDEDENDAELVCITSTGLEALKAAKGVH